jgi:hypothetical protein
MGMLSAIKESGKDNEQDYDLWTGTGNNIIFTFYATTNMGRWLERRYRIARGY